MEGLHVLYGPMKSGKTTTLLEYAAQYADDAGLYVKPTIDTRSTGIYCRNGREIPCLCIEDPAYLYERETDILFIDEAQLFPRTLAEVVSELRSGGIDIIAAGLDLDFRGEPFGPMFDLMRMAGRTYQHTAVCTYEGCQLPATRTQRLINSAPAPYDAPLIRIEGAHDHETYEPRCPEHHFGPPPQRT